MPRRWDMQSTVEMERGYRYGRTGRLVLGDEVPRDRYLSLLLWLATDSREFRQWAVAVGGGYRIGWRLGKLGGRVGLMAAPQRASGCGAGAEDPLWIGRMMGVGDCIGLSNVVEVMDSISWLGCRDTVVFGFFALLTDRCSFSPKIGCADMSLLTEAGGELEACEKFYRGRLFDSDSTVRFV